MNTKYKNSKPRINSATSDESPDDQTQTNTGGDTQTDTIPPSSPGTSDVPNIDASGSQDIGSPDIDSSTSTPPSP